MKTEFGIIITCTIIVVGVMVLIVNEPDDVILISGLERINQQALDAKESEDQPNLDSYKVKMQDQLKKVTSYELGIPVETIFLKEDWNYPFRDSSEIKPHREEHKTIPICNILPNISLHLQNIRKTELFSMFSEKYQNYDIELDIADERYYNSTAHYGFSAKSGNNYASTHFHVNSCTGQTSNYLYLRCYNPVLGNHISTNFPSEVISSLKSDDFCEIHLDPWRQELATFNENISKDVKKHLEKIRQQENHSYEDMNIVVKELHRLNILSDMVRLSMDGNFDIEFSKKMKQYERGYGSLPADFVELIEKRK